MNHPKDRVRQYSDQIHCYTCGKTWDANDPEPPVCDQPRRRAYLALIKRLYNLQPRA